MTFAHRGNEIDIQQSLNAWSLPFSSNLSILRNSEIGTYTIRATGIDATFKDSDFVEQYVSPSIKFYKIGGYQTTGSSSEEYLSLYRSGDAGAEQITLNYVTQVAPSYSLRGGTRDILRGMIARGLGLR